MDAHTANEIKTLKRRVDILERRVFGRGVASANTSDWNWCKRPGCTRGCYKGKPQCLRCSDFDPRADAGLET